MKKILQIIGIIILAFIAIIFILVFTISSKGNKNADLAGNNYGSSKVSRDLSTLSSPGISNSMPMAEDVSDSSSGIASYSGGSPVQSADKKIIKNGNLNLQVEKTDSAADKISEIAKNNSGEVFSSNLRQTKSSVKSGTISIKVPVANFEKTFNEIKKIAGLVLNESSSGQDVTEQYVDLQAQLKNKQAEEQSFVKILDQSGKIDDILAVTREIARVRGNIEQLQGRMKYLESQTDMSTITINITEDQEVTVIDSWRPWQIIKESANSLIKNLQGFVNFLIKFIIVAIPTLLLYAVIIWLAYKFGRKIYQKIRGDQNKM